MNCPDHHLTFYKTEEEKQLYLKGIAAAMKGGNKQSGKEMEEFLEELE